MHVSVSAISNLKGLSLIGADTPLLIHHGHVNRFTIFVKVPDKYVSHAINDIDFQVQSLETPAIHTKYKSVFNGPSS